MPTEVVEKTPEGIAIGFCGGGAGLAGYLEKIGWSAEDVACAREEHQLGQSIVVLERVFVNEKSRGKGHGSALLDAFVASARLLGASCVVLLVDYDSDERREGFSLVRFYSSRGFRGVGATDEIGLMVLPL
jgi:GNAT superfamily N-acetyltransferase